MFSFKNSDFSKDRSSDDENFGRLVCTCPNLDDREQEFRNISNKRKRYNWVHLLTPLDLPANLSEPHYLRKSNESRRDKYSRSVSLGRILGNGSDTEEDYRRYEEEDPHRATNVLTSSGNSFIESSNDNSPDASYEIKVPAKRELTDFEKSNLLYLKELEEKRRDQHRHLERQVHDLPYTRDIRHSSSNPTISAVFSEDSSAGEFDSRGDSSHFPQRREFPPTAYSPSKSSTSHILRSVSLEEPEDESDSEDDSPRLNLADRVAVALDARGPSAPPDIFRSYRIPPRSGAKTEPESSTTWWNIKQSSSLFRMRSLSPSFPSSRPVGGSSPLGSPSLKRRTISPISIAPMYTLSCKPSSPVSAGGFASSRARNAYTHRSFSAPEDRRGLSSSFSLATPFASNIGMPKCRSDLEDVGGHAGSILHSPVGLTSASRMTVLPTTPESPQEYSLDEDTSRKNSSDSKSAAAADCKPNPPTQPVKTTPKPNPPTTQTVTKNPTLPAPPTQPPTAIRDESSQNHQPPLPPAAEAAKKPSPMAFTVELGDSGASDSSGSGSTGKKLDITGSISQWVPKHRRNLSLTKVDEHKKVEERQNADKPPLGRPRSGTVGASCMQQKKGGYHSEGYFSSDQEEDSPRKPTATDLKSPRSPRTPDGISPSPTSAARNTSQENSKGPNIRKLATKPEGRSCCKERERKPSVSELTGRSFKQEKTNQRGSETQKPTNSSTEEVDPNKDDKDDVSEAGTYTIDKDSPSPEVEETRNDIDRVFGVPTESEAEMTSSTAVPFSTTDACPDDETSWYSASEGAKNKMSPSLSRNSPNWIQQWAAHVAEQTKPSLESLSSNAKSPSLTSPRGGPKAPLVSMSPSHDSNDSRPRRKLPTPPVHQTSPIGRVSPSPSKSRARVEMAKNPAFRNCSFESHESGGDSDFDTSSSYPFQDDERLTASLRNKLRLSGLEASPKTLPSPTPPSMASPRRSDSLSAIKRDLLTKDRNLMAEGIYDTYRERQGEQSDSSSDPCSEPYKEPAKPIDNNPPLKFNRAFSLRRARLGCDDPHIPSISSEKKKLSRPSSAGAATSSSRRAPLSATKGYQSVDGRSVSSSRDYSSGRSKGYASAMPSSYSKGSLAPLENFDRTDGGRFSLRLARSGSLSIVSKSPSKAMISKKDTSKKNAPRSNSTLSAKEVDFQNWKRRKNYDPMKAAAEGRKKQAERKLSKTQQVAPSSDHRSPSPPSSLLRSASFHGTEGAPPGVRWNKKGHNQPLYNSEDDGPFSMEDEQMVPASPLRRSPTSPHQLCPSPARKGAGPIRGRRTSLEHSDEGEPHYQSPSRKISLEESGSEGKRSPLSGGQSNGSRNGPHQASGQGRPKTKMEALDNLVISTIHSLSVKVRTTSESLLQKLKSQYDEEGDRAALLDEVLSHLSESDQSMTSGQTRSTSRELAGTLRNLKKIEHALEVMDRVIIVGDEFYEDEDQMDSVPNEWIESDY